MFYAERLGGEGEPYITERGVFTSLEEFIPYRRQGWSGTQETDEAADALIAAVDGPTAQDQTRRMRVLTDSKNI